MGLPWCSDGKASACNVGGLGSIPGSRRTPSEGNGNPLQDSCLENSMEGGAWWATVHGVTESDTTEGLHLLFFLSNLSIIKLHLILMILETCLLIKPTNLN